MNNQKTKTGFPLKADELEILVKSTFEYNSDEDLIFSTYDHQGKKIVVFGISYLMDTVKLESSLLESLLSHTEAWTSQSLLNDIPLGDGSTTTLFKEILGQLLTGNIFVYIEEEQGLENNIGGDL